MQPPNENPRTSTGSYPSSSRSAAATAPSFAIREHRRRRAAGAGSVERDRSAVAGENVLRRPPQVGVGADPVDHQQVAPASQPSGSAGSSSFTQYALVGLGGFAIPATCLDVDRTKRRAVLL